MSQMNFAGSTIVYSLHDIPVSEKEIYTKEFFFEFTKFQIEQMSIVETRLRFLEKFGNLECPYSD